MADFDHNVEILRWTLVELIEPGQREDTTLDDWCMQTCHVLYTHGRDEQIRTSFLRVLNKGVQNSKVGRFTLQEILNLHETHRAEVCYPGLDEHIDEYLPDQVTVSDEELMRWAVIFVLDTFLETRYYKRAYDLQGLKNLFLASEIPVTTTAGIFELLRYGVCTSVCVANGHPLPEWTKRKWVDCKNVPQPKNEDSLRKSLDALSGASKENDEDG